MRSSLILSTCYWLGTQCFINTISSFCLFYLIGQRQQLNLVTSYIDGSTVYGSTRDDVERLRDGGKSLFGLMREIVVIVALASSEGPCRIHRNVDSSEHFLQTYTRYVIINSS